MAGITEFIPDIAFDTSGVGKGIFIVIAIAFVVSLLGLVFFFALRHLKFNKKIVIWKKINGRYEIVKKDKAQEVSLKGTGDTIFYLRRFKKYLPTPRIQTGRNVFWYVVREDGEWINIGMGDIDEKFREIGAHFLDSEMRYARTQLQGHIKERYDKPKFWAQYGALIINVAAITIIMVFLFLIIQDMQGLSQSVVSAVDAAAKVNAETARILGAVDTVMGSSGLAPA